MADTFRIGQGYDIHLLVEGRPLVIGGVTIEHDRGPLGHSDGDALTHAIIDAILGAASLGDIGRHFPPSDPAWKDVESISLFNRVLTMIQDFGFDIGNIDSTVILERPKLSPHIDKMRANIARSLDIDISQVSIKAKTNEGMSELGMGEAIAAMACVILFR
jgi:2-C-methyl-D-erythritol 2,4-cyclodiphosphate synthase